MLVGSVVIIVVFIIVVIMVVNGVSRVATDDGSRGAATDELTHDSNATRHMPNMLNPTLYFALALNPLFL